MDLYVLAGMVVALWLVGDLLIGVFLLTAPSRPKRCEACGLRDKDPVEL